MGTQGNYNIRKINQSLQSPEVGRLVKIAAVENVPAGADAIRR
jgi:hypothetical protein